MLTPEQIKDKLRDRNIREVARHVSVSYHYIVRLKNGTQSNPSWNVVKELSDYLEANQ